MKKTGSWISSDFDFDSSSSSTKSTLKRLYSKKSDLLWSDKYQPKCAKDLAVHPKKIEQVKSWLSCTRKQSSILLLTGPPGCGKTATIKALAHDLNFTVQEWSNPNETVEFVRNQNYIANDALPYVSQSNAFKSFMLRANRYPVLDVGGNSKKVVLIEELPPFVFRNTGDFHLILRQYKGHNNGFPLIFIQSDSSKEDSSLRHLFPQELLQELNIEHIQFNGIAQTNLLKALTLVATQESQKPDKTALTSLANSVNGDIRGALNALQFACLNETKGLDLKGAFEGYTSLATTSSKKPRLKTEKKKLAAIGGKDPSVDLFHAIGKVLYCKRNKEDSESVKLPNVGLKMYERNKLVIDPEELLDKIPSNQETFTSFLHQNYLEFYKSVKDVARAAEYLSCADPFFREWTSTGKIALTDYGGSLAVRGLCHANSGSVQVTGMKTFHKPEWYNTVKTARSRLDLLSHEFRKNGLSNEELATVYAPFMSEYFGHNIDSCRFKDMPAKKKKTVTVTTCQKITPFKEEDLDEEADFCIEDCD